LKLGLRPEIQAAKSSAAKVGRDLTIRRKIENGRYYCTFLPFETNQGTEAAVYEAVYAYPNRPAPFDVSAGINAGYGPRKRSPAASRRR
jgi:hypothetical protein